MARSTPMDKGFHDIVAELDDLPALERYHRAGDHLEQYRRLVGAMASIKAKAIQDLLDHGLAGQPMSATAVAEMLKISRQQMYRLLSEEKARPPSGPLR